MPIGARILVEVRPLDLPVLASIGIGKQRENRTGNPKASPRMGVLMNLVFKKIRMMLKVLCPGIPMLGQGQRANALPVM